MAILDPTTVSRFGQVNGAGDALALFLKVFSGEVFSQFEKDTMFKDRHFVRSIKSGKSAQFPVIGRATAAYHTPGAWIEGGVINHAERIISTDGLLTSSTFIADIDEAMNHYEVRSRYVNELSMKLAQLFDRNVAGVMTLAARAAATITGEAGGSQITNAAMATDVNVLTAALFASAQTLDEKWVPKESRQAFVRPAQFYALAQSPTLINKFYDGSGSISKGTIDTVAGFPIIKVTSLPSTDLSADATVSPSAQGNYVKTVALVNHPDSVGTVKLLDVAVEQDREVRRQGWFFIAKYAAGQMAPLQRNLH